MQINYKTVKYIPGLDGFRAIAVLLVMVAHFGFKDIVPGGLGVTIFFFISGFLITTLLLREREDRGGVNIKGFYVRRFFRLMPELLALLIVSGLYRTVLGDVPSLSEVAAALTYTTNYFVFWSEAFGGSEHISFSWPQLWSLAVEEHYYITYPLIFTFVLVTPAKQRAVLGAVLVGCLMYRTLLVKTGFAQPGSLHPYTYVASEARFDSIAYGAALAFAMQRVWTLSVSRSLLLGIFGAVIIIASLAVRDPEFRETLRYSVQGVGLFMVFAAFYNGAGWDWAIKIMDWRIIRRIGILSYGAYLWHLEYLYLAKRLFGIERDALVVGERLAFTGLGLVLTFIVADLSFRYVAGPFRALRTRFGSHPTT